MSTSKKPTHSTAQHTDKSSGKSKAAQPNLKKPTVAELPDLEPIFNAFIDAYAIVHCASKALHGSDPDCDDDEGLAINALRQGSTALGAAIDRLERAEMQVSRFRERAGGAS